jgi:hypothetical protein
MRKLMIACMAALLLCAPVQAENWTEISAQFFEVLNDETFAPGYKVQVTNYVANMGIGGYVGENDAVGVMTSWRVFDHMWGSGIGLATHLGANSDFGTASADKPKNLAYVFEPRFLWSGANGHVEVGLPVQYTTIDGMNPEWTIGFQLHFRPGGAAEE